MARFNSPLARVQVAAPCQADWNQMMGDERVRFCGQCSLNVYNLSAMTRAEAETLIARNEGRLCVKFYRRRDGSIITRNCPVGLRAIRRRVSYVAKAITSAVLSFGAGVGLHEAISSSLTALRPGRMMGVMERPVDFQGQVIKRKNIPELELIQGTTGPVMPLRNPPVLRSRKRPR
jgi:hypothetical protein